MSESRRKSAKKKERPDANSSAIAASSKPTPKELISFCKDIGLDLFGTTLRAQSHRINTTEDYETVRQNALTPNAELKDKLRHALNWWTDVCRVAAEVINETRPPSKLSKSVRLELRWRRSKKIPIPKRLIDEAELGWVIACQTGNKISMVDAVKATTFKTEHGLRTALRSFGCPSELAERLTEIAVKQLCYLQKQWIKAQNAARSEKRRARGAIKQKMTVT